MSSLQESLAALSGALPELPAKLEQLVTDAKDVDQATADILAAVGKRRAELAEHLGQIQQAVHEVASEATEGQTQVKAGGDAIEAASDQVVSGVSEQADAVETRAKEGEAALGTLEQALAEAGQEAQDGSQQISQGIQRLDQVLSEGHKNVTEAVETLSNELRELDNAFDEAKTAVTEGADSLAGTLHQFAQQVKARADQAALVFDALCDALTQVVHDEEKHVTELVKETTDEVRAVLEKELKQQAGEAATQISAALDGLARTLGQAESDTRAQKDTLEQRVNDLRSVAEPLPAAVTKVQGAVQEAGLSWS
jgi:ABC-type transporter Mla subunit MlaD